MHINLDSFINEEHREKAKNIMAPNIDTIILKLLTAPDGPEVVLDCSEIKLLSTKSIQHFKQQPILLELDTPVNICGDIHGQYQDLLRIFRNGNHPPHSNYLFLGDYVDRGNKSVEVLCLLLAYKIKYPEQFFLLRGNHEDKSLNVNYGFQKECLTRYKEQGNDVFDLLTSVFGWMPVSALIMDRILCMHGGISPQLNDLDQIRDLDKGRPYHVVPRIGLLCDLLWADPNRDRGESRLHFDNNHHRNQSYMFDEEAVKHFLKALDLDLIVRAHEVADEGYEFFAGKSLVTVFSAPKYCGTSDNKAAVLHVDKNLLCTFYKFE